GCAAVGVRRRDSLPQRVGIDGRNGLADVQTTRTRHERVRARGRRGLPHLLVVRARAGRRLGHVPVARPRATRPQRDRLADTPVAIFSAVWTIIQWNELFAALQGDPSEWEGKNRNLVWRHFAGDGSRV